MVPLSARDLSLFSDWFKVGFLEGGGGNGGKILVLTPIGGNPSKPKHHSYYLPMDSWPSSVLLKNITNFTPTTQPPPLHATLTIGAVGASP